MLTNLLVLEKIYIAVSYEPTLRENFPYSELFWAVFSRIRTEYGEILRISPHSVQMRENVDQNNSKYGHFLRSAFSIKSSDSIPPENTRRFSWVFRGYKMRILAKNELQWF